VVLRPAKGLHALGVGGAAGIDVLRDVGRAHEADRGDIGMVEDRIDHFLVAMDNLQQPFGRARLHEQFGQPHRHAGVTLRRLEDEGIARRNRHAEHPHRDHGGEVERGDPCADTKRLAHRIDIDAGAGTLRIFAFQRMRNAAGELDHFEPALDIAMRILDHLAVLARQQFGQRLLVRLDQFLEPEHHSRAALRIGGGPLRLDLARGGHRLFKQGRIAQCHFGLDLTGRGVPHLVLAGWGGAVANYEMVDLTHDIPDSPSRCPHGARGRPWQGHQAVLPFLALPQEPPQAPS